MLVQRPLTIADDCSDDPGDCSGDLVVEIDAFLAASEIALASGWLGLAAYAALGSRAFALSARPSGWGVGVALAVCWLPFERAVQR